VQWYTTPLSTRTAASATLGIHSELSEEVRAAKHQAELLIDGRSTSRSSSSRPRAASRAGCNAVTLFGCPTEQALGQPFEEAVPSGGRSLEASPGRCWMNARAGARTEYEGWLKRGADAQFWGNLLLYPQLEAATAPRSPW